ncbi:uncharacterized RNA-binding protein P16F5.06-like [Varroa destructor]|uniref:RRM domain-containing protein n=1 Tax=Varroa destructor TaxID=109461 RepID=A0A7M7JM37_VARDE|nr:uncharacterized RNA-binding protein P16F5.06-like [Varroa destructor]
MDTRRLYIGGISESTLENDIKAKFGEFGSVKSVEIRCKENYGNRRYFAYIDIEADSKSIDNCVHQCNNLEWKGGCLKVQPAKESYLQKTQKEIFERKIQTETFTKGASSYGSFGQYRNEKTDYKPEAESQTSQKNCGEYESEDHYMEVDKTNEHPNDKKRGSGNDQGFDGHHSCHKTRKFSQEHDRHNQNWKIKRKYWKGKKSDNHDSDERNIHRKVNNREDVRQKKSEGRERQTWERQEFGGTSTAQMNWDSSLNRQQRSNQRFNGQRDSRRLESHSLKDDVKGDKTDTFESRRDDLFEEIDAADDIGKQDDDEMPNLDEDGKSSEGTYPANWEREDDPISEDNLKKLFDQKENQGFTLSSLFADQLKVEEMSSSDDDNENDNFPRRMRRDSRNESHTEERFGDDYWRRIEDKRKVHQKSWEEMRYRANDDCVQPLKSGTLKSFFFLPGDERLNEGSEVFQTNVDPQHFIDAWAEQAEQLTLRLFQRKTNAGVQHQIVQRLANGGQGLQRKSLKKGAHRGSS